MGPARVVVTAIEHSPHRTMRCPGEEGLSEEELGLSVAVMVVPPQETADGGVRSVCNVSHDISFYCLYVK